MINEGDLVILAVSGGPDSLCLLDILNQIKCQLKISLIVAHVHHGIRKKEADIEARYVRLKAFHMKIPFHQLSLSIPEIARKDKISIEQAGRVGRYSFFKKLLKKNSAQKIALGHHMDDQVETILMRIIRGSGLRGLKAIPPKRDVFIRPLIECTRSEIESYCKRRRIAYCLDSTNIEPIYLRNKIRQQLIPLLKEEYNPAIEKSLLQLQSIVRDELNFLDEITEYYYLKTLKKECIYYIILDNQILRDWPIGIQRSVVRRTLRHFKTFLENIQFKHIEAIRSLYLQDKGGKTINLPGGIIARKSYQDLIIGFKNNLERKEKPPASMEFRLEPGKATIINGLSLKFVVQQCKYNHIEHGGLSGIANKNEAYLDYDKLDFPLKARSRKPGDRFQPLNSAFFKKIKSYFIDEKVDLYRRDRVMLILDNSDRIVWIAGFQIDNRFKVTKNTKRILHIKKINRPD